MSLMEHLALMLKLRLLKLFLQGTRSVRLRIKFLRCCLGLVNGEVGLQNMFQTGNAFKAVLQSSNETLVDLVPTCTLHM